jgi:hypothetical protein
MQDRQNVQINTQRIPVGSRNRTRRSVSETEVSEWLLPIPKVQ